MKEHYLLPSGLFRKLFWNFFALYIPIFITLGVLSLLGIRAVEFNGEPTFGIFGFATAIIMGPFIAFVTAFATWIMLIIGNFILKLFFKLVNRL